MAGSDQIYTSIHLYIYTSIHLHADNDAADGTSATTSTVPKTPAQNMGLSLARNSPDSNLPTHPRDAARQNDGSGVGCRGVFGQWALLKWGFTESRDQYDHSTPGIFAGVQR